MNTVFTIIGVITVSWILTKIVIGDYNAIQERREIGKLIREFKSILKGGF